eukprot:CAMPEP_0168740818 /NCGR_PEP_ID=MMETSP0724-20121128/12183_1 /TAXON_ID=265536 /ORGANISM="Amphiprora sp., Strain CCMP467" /LENGTH=390 /DNA_ID=CAMNT_0008788281 /DNA_START=385 /DNA_END=1557 /DNA_ORIENTATION=+
MSTSRLLISAFAFALSCDSLTMVEAFASLRPLHLQRAGAAPLLSSFASVPSSANATLDFYDTSLTLPPPTTFDDTTTVTLTEESLQYEASTTLEQVGDETLLTDDESLIGTLQVWKQRLFTKTDFFNSHKFSGAGLTLSSLAIIGVGLPSGFQEIPDFLEPMSIFLCGTVLMQAMSSFHLAFTHRRMEPEVRNVFLNGGVSCLLLSFSAFWGAPFPHSAAFFDANPLVGKAIYSFMSLVGIGIGLDAFINFEALLESQLRYDRSLTVQDSDKVSRAVIGIIPYLISVPINMLVLYFLGFLCDREEFLDLFLHTSVSLSVGDNFYQLIFSTLGVSYLFLFVTLRDKQLISKDQELALTVATAMPVIACLLNQFLQFAAPALEQAASVAFVP